MANLSSYLPDGIDESNVAITGGSISGTTIAAPTITGQVILSGTNGSATNSLDLDYNGTSGEAKIQADSGGGNAFLTFGTSDSGTVAERVRIDKSGNVGIGTNNPNVYANFTTLTLNGATSSALDFQGGGALMAEVFATSNDLVLQTTNSDGELIFKSAAGVEAARIDTSGRVLVGKTSSSLTTAGSEVTSGSILQSASSTSTNLATNNGGVINLCNISATDGNFSNIGGYNSNGLVVAQMNFINLSHSSRTGAITFTTHSGSAFTEAMRIHSSADISIGSASNHAGARVVINDTPPTAFGSPMFQVGQETFTGSGMYSIGFGYTAASYTEPPVEIAALTTSDSGGTKADIVFGTRSVTTNTAVTERMRILTTGNVLVGKNSSLTAHARFEVATTETTTAISAGAGAAISIQNLSTTNNTYSTIYFTNGGGGVDSCIYGVHEVGNGTGSSRSGSLVFATADGSSGVQEKMRIDSAGKVGIGTSTPGSYHSLSQFVVAQSGDAGITIASGSSNDGRIFFADGTSGSAESEGTIRYDHSDNSMHFSTADGVRMSINSAGNAIFGSSGQTKLTTYNDSTYSGIFNGSSLTSDEAIYFGAGNEFHYLNGALSFQISGSHTYLHNVFPRQDDTFDVGGTANRFDDIYATNGTINTSDRNEKQDIEALSEAEQRVAVAAKSLLRKFRWRSSVVENGDNARIHYGIIAQDLQAAFAAEGLDAGRYGMFINTTWTDEETGEERSRMGVRYSELLAFIITAI